MVSVTSQSLILEGVAPLDEQSYTRNNVLVTGVGNECIQVPSIILTKLDLVTGPVAIVVTPSLPKGLEGVTLLLGNDVTGRKVVEPVMSKTVSSENNTAQLEEDIPGIVHSCVTTRLITSKDTITSCYVSDHTDIDLSETFMTKPFMSLQENSPDVQPRISSEFFL